MAITQKCNHCGHKITAPDQFAGHEVNCPACGEAVRVEEALEADDLLPARVALAKPEASTSEVSDEKVPVRCDRCFQPYLVPPSNVDVDFDCPKCGHTFRVLADALQPGRNPEASGTRNLQTAAARDAATIGDELLVELATIDQQDLEGAPIQAARQPLAWLPSSLRRPAIATMTFIEEHPMALALSTVGIVAWTIVLVYFLR